MKVKFDNDEVEGRHPLLRLGEADLNMVTAFVLASGSIKDLAGRYGVSYPTMRGRLDELIVRLRAAVENRPSDPLREYLADQIAQGLISAPVARRIRDLHEQALAHTGPAPVPTEEKHHDRPR